MQSQPTNFPSGEHRATLPGAEVYSLNDMLRSKQYSVVVVAGRDMLLPGRPTETQHQLDPSENPSTGRAQSLGLRAPGVEQSTGSTNVLYPPRGVVVTDAPHMLLTRGTGTAQPVVGRASARGVRASDLGARESVPAPASPSASCSSPAEPQASCEARTNMANDKK